MNATAPTGVPPEQPTPTLEELKEALLSFPVRATGWNGRTVKEGPLFESAYDVAAPLFTRLQSALAAATRERDVKEREIIELLRGEWVQHRDRGQGE